MATTDSAANSTLAGTLNEDSVSSASKTGSINRPKHYVQHFPPQINTQTRSNIVATVVDDRDKASFYKDLYHFHEVKG